MGATLQDILGARRLIGLTQAVVGGLPTDILPAGFWPTAGNTETVEGNMGSYLRVEGNRKTAQLVHYGAPSKKVNLTGISEVPVTLIHTFENITLKPTAVTALLSENNDAIQNMGAQTVARQCADFGQRFKNLRISAAFSALILGKIYFDGEGNLQPTSASAKVTVDYGVAAGHLNQLATCISASWATDGTDVLGDLEKIKAKARKDWGAPLKYAFYGSAVPEYLQSNTAIKALVGGSYTLSEQVAKGVIPPLGGLTWLPLTDAFFNDYTDTAQSWMPTDTVVFTPEPSPEWWGWLEGTFPVPTGLSISGDASAALRSLSPVKGPFSYAAVSIDPPGVTQYGGDTFLPIIKAPNAIFIADVVA